MLSQNPTSASVHLQAPRTGRNQCCAVTQSFQRRCQKKAFGARWLRSIRYIQERSWVNLY